MSMYNICIIGGPKTAGKSTVLKNLDRECYEIHTGSFLYELAKERYDVDDREKVLDNGLPIRVGDDFIYEIHEKVRENNVTIDTHFYVHGYLGIPKKSLEKLNNGYSIKLVHLTNDLDTLLKRRHEKGYDTDLEEVINDKYGNHQAFDVYKEVLAKNNRLDCLEIKNDSLEETLEKIEGMFENDI